MEGSWRFPGTGHRAFRDRGEAGSRLAGALAAYRGTGAVVLGIPRGGIPIAAAVADALDAELDAVVARKVGAPSQPELAIGAVTANGGLFLDEAMIAGLDLDEAYLRQAIAREAAVARQREARFRGAKPATPVEARTVLLVDDGLATGATMRAAARSIRKRRPAKLIVAVPVGSRQACEALRPEVDEIVCLLRPEPFCAVGLHYLDFAPVEDDEVWRILDAFAATRPAPSAAVDAPPASGAP